MVTGYSLTAIDLLLTVVQIYWMTVGSLLVIHPSTTPMRFRSSSITCQANLHHLHAVVKLEKIMFMKLKKIMFRCISEGEGT